MSKRDPWDDDLAILSAENVNFAVETAGLGSRFGAALIDLLLQTLVLALLAWAASWLIDLFPIGEWARWAQAIVTAVGVLVGALIAYGYSFFFEWLWDGQTPGKRWLGLRVLRTGGMPIGAWEAMIRSVMRTVDFLPVFYGVGATVALLNPHNRRVGDLVAGTIVARERHEAGQKHVLDIDAAAAAFLASCAAPLATSNGALANGANAISTEEKASALASSGARNSDPISPERISLRAALNEQDIELVREFFVRREALKPQPRKRLALSLAARLAAKLGQSAPGEDVAERWLEELARLLFATA